MPKVEDLHYFCKEWHSHLSLSVVVARGYYLAFVGVVIMAECAGEVGGEPKGQVFYDE